MFKRGLTICALLMAGLAANAGEPTRADKPERQDEKKILLELDRKFDSVTAKKGAAGWASFFAPNGSMCTGDQPPVTGPEKIRKAMEKVLGRKGASLRWKPTEALVWIPGLLGTTTGRYESMSPAKDGSGTVVRHGTYFTIWKKQPDGHWKVLFDTGAPDREGKKREGKLVMPGGPWTKILVNGKELEGEQLKNIRLDVQNRVRYILVPAKDGKDKETTIEFVY